MVSLFKSLLDHLSGLRSLGWLGQGIQGYSRLDVLDVQGVTGWKQMVVVDDLDKWLDLSSLGHFLGSMCLGDFEWVSVNTSNYSMWERVGFGTFIVRLNNHNFSTSETSTNDNS